MEGLAYILSASVAVMLALSSKLSYLTSVVLDGIPNEILSEIVGHLDWLDLLHARMTCKLLYDVSKLRSVRVSLVARAIDSDPYSTPLDRPIKCFSTEELERWAMQRLSAEKGWLLDDMEPTHSRTVKISGQIEASCLIDGGRWLLTVIKGGQVIVTDLDHPDFLQQVLIEPREELDIWPTTDLLYSIDPLEAILTFDLALLHGRPVYRSAPAYPSRRLCVWRVVLAIDGASLSAHHMNSFWTNGLGHPRASSFSGNYFARVVRDDVLFLEIFQWKLSTSDLHHKAAFRLQPSQPGVLHLAILSKDRALVVSDGFIRIYKMPELQSSTDLTTADPPSHCALHVIALPGGDARLGGLSRPRVHSRQTWFALYTGSGVYALKIPCDEHCPPCFSTLSDFETTEPSDACVGFRRAVVRSTYSSVFALSYACPGAKDNDSAARVTMIRHLQLPEGSMRPTLLQMDEGSGRVIQEDSGAGLSVFDFALYHRSGT